MIIGFTEDTPQEWPSVDNGLSHRWYASKLQIKAERNIPTSASMSLLERLEKEGPEPVWDLMVADHPTLFNGNSTTNRRLRAFAANRMKEKQV